MKNFYRVMLGRKSIHAKACFDGGFTGTHFDIHEDLTGKLTETWRPFNAAYVPIFLKIHPDKSKVAAGLACGAIWTVSKMLRPGDVILSPDGTGTSSTAITRVTSSRSKPERTPSTVTRWPISLSCRLLMSSCHEPPPMTSRK